MQHIIAHSGGMEEWLIQIPSMFLFFFHPNKIFVSSLYGFYAHAHETTPTPGYTLSHTHIVVEEGP